MRNILRLGIEDGEVATTDDEAVAQDLANNEQERDAIDDDIGTLVDMREAITTGRTLKMESMDLDLSTLLTPVDEEGNVDEAEAAKRTDLALESIGTAISNGVKKAISKLIEFVNKIIAWFKSKFEYRNRHDNWSKYVKQSKIDIDPLAHQYLSTVKFDDKFMAELVPELTNEEVMWIADADESMRAAANNIEWLATSGVINYINNSEKLLKKFRGEAHNQADNVSERLVLELNKLNSESVSKTAKTQVHSEKKACTAKQVADYLTMLNKHHTEVVTIAAKATEFDLQAHVTMLESYRKDLEHALYNPTDPESVAVQYVREAQIKFILDYFKADEEMSNAVKSFYSAAKKIGNWLIRTLLAEIEDIEKDPKQPTVKVNSGPYQGQNVTQADYYRLVAVDMKKFITQLP